MSNSIFDVDIEQSPKVEDFLRDVNYADLAGYQPSDFALDFVNFIKMVNGGESENKTPPVHYRMIDNFINDNDLDTINMCHRGIAKSTLKEFLILYIGVYGELPNFGKVPYALYVSDSIDNGVKKMRKALEFRINNSAFLQKYIKEIRFTDIRWEIISVTGNSFVVSGHGAKALSLDSMVFREYDQVSIKDCEVGDKIYGADGKLCNVIAKSEVFNRPMYEIVLEDGRKLKVCEDHLNPVLIKNKHSTKKTKHVLTTKELLKQPLLHIRDKGNRTTKERLIYVENCRAVEYPEENLPIDPYTLGVVLGDGRIRKDCGSVELTAHIDDFEHYLKEIPYEFGKYQIDSRNVNVKTQSIRGLGRSLVMMKLNVHGDYKFIPELYLRGSIEQRLSLLQGLMDTDGTIGDRKINPVTSFCSNSKDLIEGVKELVYSLGGYCIEGRTGEKAYRLQIHLNKPLFKLTRKLKVQKFNKKEYVAVKAINRISDEPSQCIRVDNADHEFITEMYFRTHNTGVRGTRENGSRPVLALLDDLISDSDARSPTIIADVEDTIYNAIDHALNPNKRKIIWSGTPFNAKDPLYKAVESGAWNVNVYPVCEQFPCEREDFKGSWPDRFTYDYVSKLYTKAKRSGKLSSFNQELMLQIMSDEERLILESDIQWYSRKNLMKQREYFNFYITTDFATSDKQSADYSVISVWAVNADGHFFWVDGVCKKQTMDVNIKDLFRLVQMYRPISVGVEVTGQQGGFIPYINEQMMKYNTFFAMASENNSNRAGIRPTTNKHQRFNIVLPYFKQYMMHFPKELADEPIMIEAMEELGLICGDSFKSKHDDFIDTISMLGSMNIAKPSKEGNGSLVEKNDVFWDEDDDEDSVGGIENYIV